MTARTIVVGLGNPGLEYASTRHNIGYCVVDGVARGRGLRWHRLGWLRSPAWLAEDDPLILVKPRTFMNRAGVAARAVSRRYHVGPERVLAVYDDADLELGHLRIRRSGGSGGHNGMRSLAAELGSEAFPRLRLGVKGAGRNETDLADYLLSPFEENEQQTVAALLSLATRAVEAVVDEGVETAMNRFNRLGRVDHPANEP